MYSVGKVGAGRLHFIGVTGRQEASKYTLGSTCPTCAGFGPGHTVRVLDLACGSGEATQSLAEWYAFLLLLFQQE